MGVKKGKKIGAHPVRRRSSKVSYPKVENSVSSPAYCNVNVKGANIGDFYYVYLDGKAKPVFAGTISEENFTITIPTEKVSTIRLKIKPQKGKIIQKNLIPKETIDVLLKPASQIRESDNKKHFASIREMLAERRKQLALQENL